MIEVLRSFARAIWKDAPLRKKLQSDQWFLLMSMYVAEVFDKTARTDLKFKIEETQFVAYLRNQADQATRQKVGEELSRRLLAISAHPVSDPKSRIIECRKWIVSLANEYGKTKLAFVTDPDWSTVPDHPRHACVKGLGDCLEKLLEEVEFTEYCREATSFDAAVTLLKSRNMRLNFDLSVANTGRAFLGDIDSDVDWLRPFMNSIMAVHEARLRVKLDLPPACERSYDELSHEYEAFAYAVLTGA